MTLKERLKDWVDFDIAMYELAVVLGIFKDYRIEGGTIWDHAPKWVFWSRNPLGDKIGELLYKMVDDGLIEEDDEESRFRWAEGKVEELLSK